MEWISIGLLVLAVLLIYGYMSRNKNRKQENLPPGPRGLPFLGYLPLLRPNRYVVLQRLAKQYGDIFTLPYVRKKFIVISSLQALREALIDQGSVFHLRPRFRYAMQLIENSGILFTDGVSWQENRRFILRALRDLGFGRELSLNAVHREIQTLEDFINSCDSGVVNTKCIFTQMTTNVICTLTFGDRVGVNDPRFAEMARHLDELIDLSSATLEFIPLYFPFMLDYPRLMKWFNKFTIRGRLVPKVRQYIRDKIKEHEATIDDVTEPRDLTDALLLHRRSLDAQGVKDHCFNETQTVGDLFDLFAAGTDTTATTLTWGCLLLAINPEIQHRARREIISELGPSRLPTMQDRSLLNYTLAVIDEIARFSSIAPTSLWHKTSCDTELRGFHIPKDSIVIPNIYAVHMDPNLWKNPSAFDPNNFLNSQGAYQASDNLIPFSIGKRSCLGESLARMEMFVFFVAVIQRYELSMADEAKIDIQSLLEGDDGFVRHVADHMINFNVPQ